MAHDTRSDLFISLLNNELEAERTIRKRRLVARSRANAERFKQFFTSDSRYTMSAEPMDCVQMMTEKPRGNWIG